MLILETRFFWLFRNFGSGKFAKFSDFPGFRNGSRSSYREAFRKVRPGVLRLLGEGFQKLPGEVSRSLPEVFWKPSPGVFAKLLGEDFQKRSASTFSATGLLAY